MDQGLTLLDQARVAGLHVRAEGERLIVRGPRAAEAVAQQLLARKPELLTELAREQAEVRWRVEVMLGQITPGEPIGRLVARPGLCMSCAEPLTATQQHICGLCVRAKEQALNEALEGVVVPALGIPPTPQNNEASKCK